MSRFPTLRITGGPEGFATRVELDGKRLEGVTKVELVADVAAYNVATITLVVEPDVDVTIGEAREVRPKRSRRGDPS